MENFSDALQPVFRTDPKIRLRSMIGCLANEAIPMLLKKARTGFCPDDQPDFVPMINPLLPATLQPTFRTDPKKKEYFRRFSNLIFMLY